MNTLTKVAVTLALGAMMSATSAQMVIGKSMYSQNSGYWRSFLLVLPDAVSSRAATPSTSGSGISLAFEFIPPSCLPILEFLLSFNNPAQRDVARSDILVTLRTDSGPRVSFQAGGYTTMGDATGMVFVLNDSNLMGQIGEMSRGQVLRTKVVYGNDEAGASYDTYSLIGMTAAFRRAATMCSNPAQVVR